MSPVDQHDDLERRLRELRPGLDDAGRARLDLRVEPLRESTEERTAPSSAARAHRWWLLPSLGFATCALVALTTVGLALRGAGSDEAATGGGSGPAPSASSVEQGAPPERAAAAPTGAAAEDSTVAVPGTVPPIPPTGPAEPLPPAGRRNLVEVSASISVRTRDVERSAQTVLDQVDRLRGQVVDASIATARASLGLRVPSDRVDEVLRSTAALGRVTARERTLEDLSGSLRRQDRSLARLDRRARRLERLRRTSGDPARRAAARRELALLDARVRTLRAQRGATRDRARTATLDVTLERGTGAAAKPAGEDDEAAFPSLRWTTGAALSVLEVAGALLAGTLILVLPLLGLLWTARRTRQALTARRSAAT